MRRMVGVQQDALIQPPPILVVTLHSGQLSPSTSPVPLQAGHRFSPVPGVPGGASSPGFVGSVSPLGSSLSGRNRGAQLLFLLPSTCAAGLQAAATRRRGRPWRYRVWGGQAGCRSLRSRALRRHQALGCPASADHCHRLQDLASSPHRSADQVAPSRRLRVPRLHLSPCWPPLKLWEAKAQRPGEFPAGSAGRAA